MLEANYRSFLERQGLGPDSINSYVSNAKCVERLLCLDLQTCDLSEFDVLKMRDQLSRGSEATHLSRKQVASCMTAVRRYAECRDSHTIQVPALHPTLPAEIECCGRIASSEAGALRAALADYRKSLEALRCQGVSRTGNSIVGNHAEYLFARTFAWRLVPNSRAAYDATDAQGRRYQIKARRLTASPGSRQLGNFRRLPDAGFDALAAALFNESFGIERAILVPYDIVSSRASYIRHTNSWRFMLDDKVWCLPGVRDVTSELRAACNSDSAGSTASANASKSLDDFTARWRSTLTELFTKAGSAQNV